MLPLKRLLPTVALVFVLVSASAVASAGPIPGQYIVVLKDSVGDPGAVAQDHQRRFGARRKAVYADALKGYTAEIPANKVAPLRSDSAVEFVVQDRTFPGLRRPRPVVRCEEVQGQDQCLPNGIDRIDADVSSTRAGNAHGKVDVNVAVIDSGIDIDHPDLNVAGGADCSTGTPDSRPASFDDKFGHGTAVAGVVGARDNKIGVVGVAPSTPLWAVAVVDFDEEISVSNLVCAVDWVTATRRDRDRKNDIAVANISVSGEGSDDGRCGLVNQDPLHLAICKSVASGVTYAVAAGNDEENLGTKIPATYREVLTATAMSDFDGKPGGREPPICYGFDFSPDRDDEFARFSNFAVRPGDARHVLAGPGVCIDTTVNLDSGFSYIALDGTSFSSPHVAGTAALCMASGQCAGNPAQTMRRLLDDAVAYNYSHPRYGFLGDPFRPIAGKYYGWLINAGLY